MVDYTMQMFCLIFLPFSFKQRVYFWLYNAVNTGTFSMTLSVSVRDFDLVPRSTLGYNVATDKNS